MKTIQVTEPIEAAKELIKHLVERRREQLGIANLGDTKSIRSINSILQNQLDVNQYQFYRKFKVGTGNPTFTKLIELAQTIDPTAIITITIQ